MEEHAKLCERTGHFRQFTSRIAELRKWEVRLRHGGRPTRRKLNSRRSYIIPAVAQTLSKAVTLVLLCFAKTLWIGILDTSLRSRAPTLPSRAVRSKTSFAVIHKIRKGRPIYRERERKRFVSANAFLKNIEYCHLSASLAYLRFLSSSFSYDFSFECDSPLR